jgi:hypothetical protein
VKQLVQIIAARSPQKYRRDPDNGSVGEPPAMEVASCFTGSSIYTDPRPFKTDFFLSTATIWITALLTLAPSELEGEGESEYLFASLSFEFD